MDKTSIAGGYWLGIENGLMTFKIELAREEIVVRSMRAIQPGIWTKIDAGFTGTGLYLKIDDGERIATSFAGPVPSNINPLYIGASMTGIIPQQHFYGALGVLSIFAATEYVDIEEVNIAVLDLTKFENSDSLLHYDQILNFDTYRRDLVDRALTIPWAGLYEIMRNHFPVVTRATFAVKSGVVEGTIQGVQGLNFIAVAAVWKGNVTYYGEALFYARRDRENAIDITLYEL